MAKAAPSKIAVPRFNPAHDRTQKGIIDRLRLYHRVGREANDDAGDRPMPSRTMIDEIARRYGIMDVTLRKARSFAREYEQVDLDRFCKLRRPNGRPLHWGFIQFLLLVADKGARRRLEKQAAENGWTPRRLYAEIRRN